MKKKVNRKARRARKNDKPAGCHLTENCARPSSGEKLVFAVCLFSFEKGERLRQGICLSKPARFGHHGLSVQSSAHPASVRYTRLYFALDPNSLSLQISKQLYGGITTD